MEPIEVNNHCKNKEFPTRVSIIDFQGEYDDPDYTFSVQVQVEYNHVIDGKEENLVTFTFWTKEDTTWCHGEDEDGEPCMTEEEVEEWFEEGLHEDLSFHDLEGLEDLDLFAAGVPTEISEDEYDEPEGSIISAIERVCGDIVDEYDCECADDYYCEDEYDEEDKEELKKLIDAEVKKFIDEYIDEVFQSGCSLEIVKYCCQIAIPYIEDFCITDRLDDAHQEMLGEMEEEWGMEGYIYKAIKQYGKEVIPTLEERDNIGEIIRDDKIINYEELREVLKYQVEKVLDEDTSPGAGCVPIIGDLDDRTMRIFKYVCDEIVADDELKSLFSDKNIDGIVERLVQFITKHDGTLIPPPFKDIDDWWGNFNGTINYCVWSYKEEMESERRWAERHKNW